jgi:hypothetical protein
MNESVRKKIEERAYQLFLKRGGAHGHSAEDWNKAEKEVLAEEAANKPSGTWSSPVESRAQSAVQPATQSVVQPAAESTFQTASVTAPKSTNQIKNRKR